MDQWQQATFDLFAHFLEERLGRLPLDEELQSHQKKGLKFQRGRQFLQDYFGDRLMGRFFCLIESEDDKRFTFEANNVEYRGHSFYEAP
ncbi:hypothetical protein CGMCC3_g16382 [Colletotrichum fructicola]|nr:uncharacterized protein CGMCC3_g16382 [Colletotrichum fructicola]KAE9567538.1 hypothetical protein CGMCC3_g16382 [Colletotrichum fructicola]